MMSTAVVYAIFSATLWCRSRAEIYTATSDLEFLLDTYKVVIDDLDAYVIKENKRLRDLKTILDTYKKEYIKAMEDIPDYVGNPINAFTMIKRLTTDLNETKLRANERTEFTWTLTKDDKAVIYPSIDDFKGTVIALVRLQNMYKLTVDELAEGKIKGVQYSFPMLAGDCCELGRVLYNDRLYNESIKWFMKALSKYEQETSCVYFFTEINIMESISWSYYYLGDAQKTLEWSNKLRTMYPSITKYHEDYSFFRETMDEGKVTEKPKPLSNDEELYWSLCRDDLELPPNVTKRHNPFLRLAPIKTEQRYVDPDVFVYYDVMSNREIEHVITMSKPKIKRSNVRQKLKDVPSINRISKETRMVEDDVTARISRRVTDLTGLSMVTAEKFMVNNYGVGGHYRPHHDNPLRTSNNPFENGNRITTGIFYLSDVSQGGATVFPKLGLTVFPVKNAALFWPNLHPSGEVDVSLFHGGCPVLRGSKWIMAKWIHVEGQELIRPCSLEYQDETMIRQLPPPLPKNAP